MKPVVLIVMDGVGVNPNPKGNAVLAADTPNLDYFRTTYPHTLLEASGEAVGLPAGFQGSSEVGHLSMGAGRVVEQELKRINDQLENGSLFQRTSWKQLMSNWNTNQSNFHLFGLLQDEGVHSHQDHLFKFMAQARKENPAGKIVIHPFLDGRDTPPRSTLEFFYTLQNHIKEVGNCTIGTIMGRYYGMDRVRSWKLTDLAYNCIVNAEGRHAENPEDAIRTSYQQDKTPTETEMFDEYIPPHVIGDFLGVQDGDCILHTNYRQDRAIQLSMAFVDDSYPGLLKRKPNVTFVGLTRYYDEFKSFILGGFDGGSVSLKNLTGQIISNAGLRQLRLAETQKFRHVTSFFNGKSTTPFPNEDQVEIPGRFDPSSFANHPEMEAYRVTDELLKRLEDNPYSFILVNFANGDMVGHTGDFEAAKTAVEIVDECVEIVTKKVLQIGEKIMITADHGNSDQMIDYETGQPRTSHSLNPVEFIYIADDASSKRLKESGVLSDIGPTILKLMNLPIPNEMTAEVLVKDKD
ncbi:MAG: 2,3-bisphosphoglycerate-independent phosphoglycerate mutase [Candidatus Marinimicrobia bacterium]|nr:2,3-bisphosphoglycerate-independent phosphoglycerate mutase [Candidatus Neomarinimicrobiota bacterium]